MRTRTYHKLDEVNFDFLKLIDLATDPAMKSIFEKCPGGIERVGHPTGRVNTGCGTGASIHQTGIRSPGQCTRRTVYA